MSIMDTKLFFTLQPALRVALHRTAAHRQLGTDIPAVLVVFTDCRRLDVFRDLPDIVIGKDEGISSQD
jgi:hypothetical protein